MVPTRRLFRRLPVAAALFLLATAGLGVTIAAGSDSSGSAAVLTFPAIHLGDRLAYNASVRHFDGDALGTSDPDAGPTRIDLAWTGRGTFTDGYGTTYVADRADIQQTSSDGTRSMFNETEWLKAGTTTVVGSEMHASDSMPPAAGSFLPFVYSQTTASDHFGIVDLMGGHDCFLANPLAGTSVRADQDIVIPAECNHGNATILHPLGADPVDGIPAFHFAGQFTEPSGPEPVEYWFASGIPYPVQAETRLDIPQRNETYLSTFTLVGFTPGTTVRTLGGPDQPGPAMPMARRTPWLLDDTGVDRPFPLSLAYAKASADLKEFKAYLASHPDAYVAAAQFQQTDLQGDTVRTWYVTMSDGQDEFGFLANQTEMQTGLPIPGAVHDATLLYETVAAAPIKMSGRDYPPARLLPSSFPSVAGLVSRWSRILPGTPVPQGWGIVTMCIDRACTQAAEIPFLGDGESRAAYRPAMPNDPVFPGVILDVTGSANIMIFDAAGTALVYVGIDVAIQGSEHVGTSPPPTSATPSAAAPLSANEGVVSSWVPSLPQAAEASAVGAVLAALYLFWPALKAGPLALFVRRRGDRLADHPARRSILDAVTAQPGIHFAELGRLTGLPNGTLVHHVRALVAGEALTAVASNGYACYFVGSARGRTHTAYAKAPGAKAVLEAVRQRPGLSGQEIAAATGLQPSTVHYHATRLTGAGLLASRRAGHAVLYEPLPAAQP